MMNKKRLCVHNSMVNGGANKPNEFHHRITYFSGMFFVVKINSNCETGTRNQTETNAQARKVKVKKAVFKRFIKKSLLVLRNNIN